MTINQPVKALVESVLNDEWTIVSDTEYALCINHCVHNLELDCFKINGAIRLTSPRSGWMEPAEKRWAEEVLNDWWAKKCKALDAERRAEARNKFMCLVKE